MADLVPTIDLSNPSSDADLVTACQELGFFKVINHGVAPEVISSLEEEAIQFFSLPQTEKEKWSSAFPFGYGSKTIGPNGDVGCLEYLLLEVTTNPTSTPSLPFIKESSACTKFESALKEYTEAVIKLTCRILELMARGLGIGQADVLSKMVMDEKSDCLLRLNHYPPCPGGSIIGFGEHTDPQIISVLRSNNTSGLEISLSDGSWVSVPMEESSFYVNVADCLQVLTNGRFKSVKHRVVANSSKPRVSMIFLGGPPLSKTIAPLPWLMEESKPRIYRELTWSEYKTSSYQTRLAENRLRMFEI